MLRGVPQGGKGGAVLIPYIVSQDDKGGWYDYSPPLYIVNRSTRVSTISWEGKLACTSQ